MLKNSSACSTATKSGTDEKEPPQEKDKIVHVIIRPKRHVVFDESVVDNEFAGKKSSKSNQSKHIRAHTSPPHSRSLSNSMAQPYTRLFCSMLYIQKEENFWRRF